MDFLHQLYQMLGVQRSSPSELYRQQNPGIREKMNMREHNPYNSFSSDLMPEAFDLNLLSQLPPEMLRNLEAQDLDKFLNAIRFYNAKAQFSDREKVHQGGQWNMPIEYQNTPGRRM